jgi:membrane-associated protein
MELFQFVRNLDQSLNAFLQDYGTLTYLLLFTILFCETGLVVTPFLPGDSLLFTAGALAARPGSPLSIWLLSGVLMLGALLGDNVNYWIGRTLGPRIFRSETSRLLNKKHLDRTHAFFERYGGKAILLARFVPIVRTYIPFVAGLGAMPYMRFLTRSIFAAFVWVLLCCGGGYVFGNIPWVRRNFEAVIIGIILVSLLPAVIEVVRHKRSAARQEPAVTPADV